jgi:hypothetical protein
MSSALRVILGLSMLTCVACDNGGDTGDDNSAGTGGLAPFPGASGSANQAGTSSMSGGTGSDMGGSGGGTLAAGVPLTATDGWVDMGSNALGVQGAMFAYADATSKMGLVEDFVGANACIKGEAAEVDLKCTPMAPATDCYGQFWGAAIGLNLNQPIDMTSMMGAEPMAFDAGTKGIAGFAFEITGAMVPTSLRFKIESASGEFCNTSMKPVVKGANSFKFADLQASCWKPAATNPTGDTAKSSLVKIAWQVVTKTGATVPFDYCVANVRALMQ